MNKEKIIVSSCLLGNKVRYNKESRLEKGILKLKKKYTLIPMCPEVIGGLSIPRDPSEIVGTRVLSIKGLDVTKEYEKGADYLVSYAKKHNIKACILKSKSPACGRDKVYDGTFTGRLINGRGLAAKALMDSGIKVYTENDYSILLEGEDKFE